MFVKLDLGPETLGVAAILKVISTKGCRSVNNRGKSRAASVPDQHKSVSGGGSWLWTLSRVDTQLQLFIITCVLRSWGRCKCLWSLEALAGVSSLSCSNKCKQIYCWLLKIYNLKVNLLYWELFLIGCGYVRVHCWIHRTMSSKILCFENKITVKVKIGNFSVRFTLVWFLVLTNNFPSFLIQKYSEFLFSQPKFVGIVKLIKG